jgi:phosphate transport system substrate-binding protein
MREYRGVMIAGGLALLLALAGCAPTGTRSGGNGGRTQPTTVQVKGSDTMVNLNQAWAETYMQTHKDARVVVTGGGSGTGITAMIEGKTDIAASSRQMKPEEITDATKAGHAPKEFKVALDGIAVIVNKANPVKSMTLDQLANIYTGKVKDWKQLGGKAGKIVLLAREVNSGTHVFFKEHVIQKGDTKSPADYTKTTLYLSSSQAIVTEVAQNPQAIGYVGLGYVSKDVRPLPVAKKPGAATVAPTAESVRTNAYPISRPLYYYTNGEPAGAVKGFLDFVMSPDGQAVVSELDFVPVK